jgi:hypothetical protein
MTDMDDSLKEQMLADLQKEVVVKIKQLRNKSAQTRAEAAYWLGEAGEVQAIEPLAQLYEKEKDPKVRQAAAYALGMFRAMETLIEAGDQEGLTDALIQVQMEGKFGKRASVPPNILLAIMGGLALLLVALIAANVLLRLNGDTDTDAADLTPVATVGADASTPLATPDPSVATADAAATALAVSDLTLTAAFTPQASGTPIDRRTHVLALIGIIDTMTNLRGPTTLLGQYWTEARDIGTTGGCTIVPPTIPTDYALPPEVAAAEPTLRDATGLVNIGLQLTRDGWSRFLNACANGTVSANAATELLAVTSAQQTFSSADDVLQTIAR